MIIAAAIKLPYQDPYWPEVKDLIIFVPRPGRHHNALHALHEQFEDNVHVRRAASSYKGEVQGFLTDKGEFLDRREALRYARTHCQLLKPTDKPELYSEDLW